ncbi:MAG: UDP-N-acetylmuramoyl-L-alanine--D-glutamate ligase [Phycisphaeraceae bacterium]
MDVAGKRVTVMGLGRFGGGVGVARHLIEQGADVLVTDMLTADKLQDSLDRLKGLPIEFRLGEHNVSDFTTCDLVVANPAVKPDNRFLRAAQAANIPITTEVRLLVEALPNRLRTIGITGSAGKSTTTAMIGHLLEKAGQKAWVGGNIGGSLLDRLEQIGPNDWVVLELSSFMLHHLRKNEHFPGWSPHIAVITNIRPNHLDWHGSFDAYVKDKHVILDYQDHTSDDAAVAGPGVHDQVSPRVTRWCDFGSEGDTRWKPDPPWPLLIPGEHNQLNARLASVACELAVGVEEWRCARWLADFPGLAHRLQFVLEHQGVRYFNDSKCTTPEAAELAIRSFDTRRVHIILGGYDKGSDLTPLASLAAERCAGVYTIGTTGQRIADTVERAGSPECGVVRCRTLDEAVRAAVRCARPGDVVLLSPACASWDQFDHYEQRGERFIELVRTITASAAEDD